MTVASSELEALARREHAQPHSVLGAHADNGGVVIRTLRPAAQKVAVKPAKGKSRAAGADPPGRHLRGHDPRR